MPKNALSRRIRVYTTPGGRVAAYNHFAVYRVPNLAGAVLCLRSLEEVL